MQSLLIKDMNLATSTFRTTDSFNFVLFSRSHTLGLLDQYKNKVYDKGKQQHCNSVTSMLRISLMQCSENMTTFSCFDNLLFHHKSESLHQSTIYSPVVPQFYLCHVQFGTFGMSDSALRRSDQHSTHKFHDLGISEFLEPKWCIGRVFCSDTLSVQFFSQ